MLILITYDVSTVDAEGKARLRKVAKACQNYGVRVQNSVFECVVDYVQYMELKDKINNLIDKKADSVRYYNLGKNGRIKVTHVGAKFALNVEAPIIV